MRTANLLWLESSNVPRTTKTKKSLKSKTSERKTVINDTDSTSFRALPCYNTACTQRINLCHSESQEIYQMYGVHYTRCDQEFSTLNFHTDNIFNVSPSITIYFVYTSVLDRSRRQ